MRLLLPVFVLVLVGCRAADPHDVPRSAATSVTPACSSRSEGSSCACGGGACDDEGASSPASTRATSFGAPFDEAVPEVTLSSLLASPDALAGELVRTSGRVARVCPRMGCWLELATATGEAVRVPMAGHAFSVPRDLEGKEAEVVGRVVLSELTPEMRAHLEAEGAHVTRARLAIEAVSVRIR